MMMRTMMPLHLRDAETPHWLAELLLSGTGASLHCALIQHFRYKHCLSLSKHIWKLKYLLHRSRPRLIVLFPPLHKSTAWFVVWQNPLQVTLQWWQMLHSCRRQNDDGRWKLELRQWTADFCHLAPWQNMNYGYEIKTNVRFLNLR